MIKSIADLSKHQAVTLLRFLYPIWLVVGLFGIMYVPATLIVAGDAATTASNIMSNQLLFRLGIVGSLLTQLIHIVAVFALFKLFETVNKNNALLLVIFGLVGVPIAMLNTLNRVAALVILNGANYLKAFATDQLPSLAMFFLDLNAEGILIATIFWGLWLFPLGYLVYRSGYFPKIIGVCVILAGIGYVLDSFTHIVLPNFKGIFSPVVFILTMGELLFMLWLVIRGAKIPEREA